MLCPAAMPDRSPSFHLRSALGTELVEALPGCRCIVTLKPHEAMTVLFMGSIQKISEVRQTPAFISYRAIGYRYSYDIHIHFTHHCHNTSTCMRHYVSQNATKKSEADLTSWVAWRIREIKLVVINTCWAPLTRERLRWCPCNTLGDGQKDS